MKPGGIQNGLGIEYKIRYSIKTAYDTDTMMFAKLQSPESRTQGGGSLDSPAHQAWARSAANDPSSADFHNTHQCAG
ncbi:hypothetical protein RRG08_054653 [Elysia crispata]|uniref:Uncharacterized protein n=1 Tax=Elysia crispata TaxID=231223 RepID=A0AAE1E899_9GAST|nr:hypothetical protein RRG08_054653 [Elysia crispata]